MKSVKRLLLILLSLSTFAISLLPAPSFAANSTTIFVTAPSHQLLNGVFIDDQLATDLSPVGSLGKLLYLKGGAGLRWSIDPALIEEVMSMSKGYLLIDKSKGAGEDFAKNFLARVADLAASGRVDAMVYANPSQYWVGRLTPHEKNYLLQASQVRLATLLAKPVGAPLQYLSTNYFTLTHQSVLDVNDAYATIQSRAIYMASDDLNNARLSLMRILNPTLSSTHRALLLNDIDKSIQVLRTSIRLAPGRFTVTSSTQELPITIINDFPMSATVNLNINSLNERVLAHDINGVIVAGKSKVQVLVPVKVLTSGNSALSIDVQNSRGDAISEEQVYSLSLKVISPIATWITAAAALTLFFAALLQSLRRIRRRRAA